jgi:hypothetical protein
MLKMICLQSALRDGDRGTAWMERSESGLARVVESSKIRGHETRYLSPDACLAARYTHDAGRPRDRRRVRAEPPAPQLAGAPGGRSGDAHCTGAARDGSTTGRSTDGPASAAARAAAADGHGDARGG